MDTEKDTAATFPLACTTPHGCPAKAQVRKKKKKSAVKFFLCFHRDDVALQRVVPVVSSSMATSDSELEVAKCSNQQRKPERHGFFHALKAMLFKMLLVKKIQQGKSGKTFAKERAITSGHTQEWSDHEDVPKMITKTTSAGGNPIFTYVKDKEEVAFPTMPSSLLKNEETCQDQWLNKGRLRLSHILKAVLFETALARKIQARKVGKKYGSNGSSLRSSTGESCDDDPGKLSQSVSSLTNSSVFTSSTLASTTSSSAVSRSTSHSRSISERIRSFRSISSNNIKANLRNLSDKIRSNSKSNSRNKISLESINSNGLKEEHHAHFADDVAQTEEKNKNKGKCYRSASGLCFLLMSLLGLIFYGKLWVILCTSILWLVCIPLFSLGDHKSSTNKVVIEKKEVTTGGGMLAGIPQTRTRIFQSQ